MAFPLTQAGMNGGASLAQGLHHIVDEAERMLGSAVDSGDERLDEARAKFAAQVRQMRAQLDDLQDSALTRARHAARRADLAAHDHPYAAMGIAAAAGLLLGSLLALRRH